MKMMPKGLCLAMSVSTNCVLHVIRLTWPPFFQRTLRLWPCIVRLWNKYITNQVDILHTNQAGLATATDMHGWQILWHHRRPNCSFIKIRKIVMIQALNNSDSFQTDPVHNVNLWTLHVTQTVTETHTCGGWLESDDHRDAWSSGLLTNMFLK